MNTRKTLFTVSLLAWSLLFFRQGIGINALLFTLVFSGSAFLMLREGRHPIRAGWIGALALSLVAAFSLLLQVQNISIVMWILSMLMLAIFSHGAGISALTGVLHGVSMAASSAGFMIADLVERISGKPKEKSRGKQGWKTLLLVLIPLLVATIFLLLYQQANPVFKHYTEFINLDFISWSWIGFTILGSIIMYGLFWPRLLGSIIRKEQNHPSRIGIDGKEDGRIPAHFRLQLGIGILSLLNIILLGMNVVDTGFVWMHNSLPEGMTYAESLHQGVGLLILSIVMAIALIAWLLGGDLNFDKNRSWLIKLAVLWMAQNLFMVSTNILRNEMYVEAYTLTQLRLGVYAWLFLAASGIVLTMVKILQKRTNWFLIQSLSWATMAMLTAAGLINWNLYITGYNMQHAANLDRSYLLSLSDANLPEMLNYQYEHPEEEAYSGQGSASFYRSRAYPYNCKQKIDLKLFDFLQRYDEKTWLSFNFSDRRVMQEIAKLDSEGKISSLDLSFFSPDSLFALRFLQGLQELDVSNCYKMDQMQIPELKSLRRLNLNNCELSNLDALGSNSQISRLHLSGNKLLYVKELQYLPNLTELDLSGNPVVLSEMPPMAELRSIDIGQSSVRYYDFIKGFPSLEKLFHGNAQIAKSTVIPKHQNLKELYLAGTQIDGGFVNTFPSDSLPMLDWIDISGCTRSIGLVINENALPYQKVKYLNLSRSDYSTTAFLNLFPAVETLYMGNCELYNMEIPHPTFLTRLDISNNKISDAKFLSQCLRLKYLNISDNSISDYSPVAELKFLEELWLDGQGNVHAQHIADLPRLKKLHIRDKTIIQPSLLKDTKSITFLSINGLDQNWLPIVIGMKSLKELSISHDGGELLETLKQARPDIKIM
jgi:Leucine-rich repeat (LRR) protein